MKKEGLVIYGSGGHGKVVADAAFQMGGYGGVRGWIDNTKPVNTSVLGYPILGGDADAERIIKETSCIVIAIGDNKARERLANFLADKGAFFANVTHPSAIISMHTKISEGTVVCAGAVINPDARIGKHAIINTGAIVEHDCVIGGYAHIASGVAMGGKVKIGAGTLVGTNATIRTEIKIGKNCIIGAGAVVVKDVPDGMTVAGNPAQELTKSR